MISEFRLRCNDLMFTTGSLAKSGDRQRSPARAGWLRDGSSVQLPSTHHTMIDQPGTLNRKLRLVAPHRYLDQTQLEAASDDCVRRAYPMRATVGTGR